MEHKVNNNRPWLDKEESLVIEADCTEYCREVVERVRGEGLEKEQANTEDKTGRKRSKHVEGVKCHHSESL